ncbi:zinc ribbon domain-containing protein [Cupriavidus basilensis]
MTDISRAALVSIVESLSPGAEVSRQKWRRPCPKIPPLQEGLYADVDGVPRLLASRCDACNRLFFPRRQCCGRCSSPALRNLPLSVHGSYACVEPDRPQAEAGCD